MTKLKRHKTIDSDIQRFNPDINIGLSSEQVKIRKEQSLYNFTKKQYSKSFLSIVIGNVFTFFNLLGLIVFIVLLWIGAEIGNFFFAVIFLANILIGIIQETRAKICMDKLSILSDKKCKVVRNGEQKTVNAQDIVLDDIIILSLGNQIPTDSIILEGEVEVNESLLTGESLSIKKTVGDSLLSGSFIVGGNCKAIADKVGENNYVATLSKKAKKYKKPYSELMSSLKLIIRIVGVIIPIMATAFLLKAGIKSDTEIKEVLLGTSTVIIGMIPSGMMLLTSVSLAVGIIKLYKQNTLVQDLYSLETLARADTVCFDKTGTITDGQMKVKEYLQLKDTPFDIKDVVSSIQFANKDSNQTASALSEYFGCEEKYKVTYSLPFNSERKLSGANIEGLGSFSIGAPEFVLNKEIYAELENEINQYALHGFRVLILAHSDKLFDENSIPNDFFPISLILIEDHIREDAYDTVKWFNDNNVEIKVISGDNPYTVSEVSRRVGIKNSGRCISLDGLTDDEVYYAADKYTVFGRVSPEQKAIIIKALKDKGHVTAMTGDGVNDILALKESDCAITVASGSEAARNVSHLVLMNNNFNSLPKVVYEGRRVINNVKCSASLYIMKTLYTFFMAVIMLFVPTLTRYPFSLGQMLLLEVFIIGLPSFFLSLQANDSRVDGKFFSYIISRSLPSAALMTINVIVIEIFRNIVGGSNDVYSSIGAYILTLAGVISLFNICSPFNKYRTVLFAINCAVVISVITIACCFGFPLLELKALSPLSEYKWQILTILALVLIDIPLMYLFRILFSKIKITFKDEK